MTQQPRLDWVTVLAFALMITGLLMIFGYAFGKSFGWIHSPAWVEMIPLFGGGVTVGGFCVGFGKALQRLTHVEYDLRDMKTTVNEMDKHLVDVDKRLTRVEAIIKTLLQWKNAVDEKLDRLLFKRAR